MRHGNVADGRVIPRWRHSLRLLLWRPDQLTSMQESWDSPGVQIDGPGCRMHLSAAGSPATPVQARAARNSFGIVALQALAHDIYTDLIEDTCLGFCFEVHRAVKCGYFFLDDTDPDSMKEFETVDQPGLDIFGQVYNQWKTKECVCPNCRRSIAASRFAPHLEKCLGMGRNSSRIANRRIASSKNMNKSESDQEDNDDINDNDWSYGSEKKTKKRKSDKPFGDCLHLCRPVDSANWRRLAPLTRAERFLAPPSRAGLIVTFVSVQHVCSRPPYVNRLLGYDGRWGRRRRSRPLEWRRRLSGAFPTPGSLRR
ncbi:ataxin-7-like 3 [Crotalus adamanteus]|uniref:Ataxin-7-like protein 3 n=1 Tax=Crotalus adamanteus TaxID=8729 RepID=A0AAW1B208_CROAD